MGLSNQGMTGPKFKNDHSFMGPTPGGSLTITHDHVPRCMSRPHVVIMFKQGIKGHNLLNQHDPRFMGPTLGGPLSISLEHDPRCMSKTPVVILFSQGMQGPNLNKQHVIVSWDLLRADH